MTKDGEFNFLISMSILNHLGRNLYQNFMTIIGEAISNSWDADANNVWITVDKEKSIIKIKDDGHGMNERDFQNKFLKIGYSKHKDGIFKSKRKKRPIIGAKGIGKLALLSCAQKISVYSKTSQMDEYVGGVIDNNELDQVIEDDLTPTSYSLGELNFVPVKSLLKNHKHGTIIYFENLNSKIRNKNYFIRKQIALSFQFTLLDKKFNIWVNDQKISINDLNDLIYSTEFFWRINDFKSDFVDSLDKNGECKQFYPKTKIKGFLATVEKPRYLKITNMDERVSVDLFVNGRLREKNILRHVPTARLVENYIYGQIHYDMLADLHDDPFTSSREGIVEGNKEFEQLKKTLAEDILPRIRSEWDEMRKGRNNDDEQDVDSYEKKRTELSEKLFQTYVEKFLESIDGDNLKKVSDWTDELKSDADYNINSYVYCFVIENILRKFIEDQKISLNPNISDIRGYKNLEKTAKSNAGINYPIRFISPDSHYLGIRALVNCIENKHHDFDVEGVVHLFKPLRNVVAHTGQLSDKAKSELSNSFVEIEIELIKLLNKLNLVD